MSFSDLPVELAERVIDEGLRTAPASLMALNTHWHKYLLPRLYDNVRIESIRQLRAFIDEGSGARKYCKERTLALTIHIPGNPNTHRLRSCPPGASSRRDADGDGDGGGPLIDDVLLLKYMEHTAAKSGNYHLSHIRTATFNSDWPATNSGRRAILLAEALGLCSNIKTLELELFSVQHSNVDIDFDYRRAEIEAVAEAVSNLRRLESLSWRPPAPTLPSAAVISEDMGAALSYGLKIAAHRHACEQAKSVFMRAREVVKPTAGKKVPQRSPDWKFSAAFRSSNGQSSQGKARAEPVGHPLRHVELDFGKRSQTLDPCWELMGTFFGYQFYEHSRHQCWKVTAELLAGHVIGFSNLETMTIKTSTLPPADVLLASAYLPFKTSMRLRLIDTSIGCKLNLQEQVQGLLARSDLHDDSNLDGKALAVAQIIRLWNLTTIDYTSFLKTFVASWYLSGRLEGICTWINPGWQYYLPINLLMEIDSPNLRSVDQDTHRDVFGLGLRVEPFTGDHKLGLLAPIRRAVRTWFSKNIHPWGFIRADHPWGPNEAEWRKCLAQQPEYAGREETISMQRWLEEEIAARIRRNLRERLEIYHTARGEDDPSGSFSTVEVREEF